MVGNNDKKKILLDAYASKKNEYIRLRLDALNSNVEHLYKGINEDYFNHANNLIECAEKLQAAILTENQGKIDKARKEFDFEYKIALKNIRMATAVYYNNIQSCIQSSFELGREMRDLEIQNRIDLSESIPKNHNLRYEKIYNLMQQKKTDEEIAEQMHLSMISVKTYKSRILNALKCGKFISDIN